MTGEQTASATKGGHRAAQHTARPATPSAATDPTRTLAAFLSHLSYSDLPERVRRRVHLIAVDAVANALAGWRANETPSIRGMAEALGPAGDSTVIGGAPLSTAGAAVLNGYLITAVSACDVYRPALCHVTPEVLPPALTIAERIDARGEQLLLAIAAGLETTVRLGLGLRYPAFRARGWHAPGVIGPFGGAAAVGKLLGLDADRLCHALALAGSQASGTFAAYGTAAVKFHQAHGALAGLIAGLLAAEGFQTTREILTHPDGGLFNTLSDGGDPEAVISGLGERWELENISLRLWPTAAGLQSAVGALMALVGRHGLLRRDVRGVRIALPPTAYRMHGTMGWQDRLSAMLSARYVASVVLHDRACWLDQFDPAHLGDPAIQEFARSCVDVGLDQTIEPDGATVTVTTCGGEELRERRAYPKGDPRDPLTYGEVIQKLRAFGEPVLGIEGTARAGELLGRLHELGGVRSLCASLRGSP